MSATERQICSLDELKQAASKAAEFFILLSFGGRSSKNVTWDEKEETFHVMNWIDGTEQRLTESDMLDKSLTNIGMAIQRGAFFAYGGQFNGDKNRDYTAIGYYADNGQPRMEHVEAEACRHIGSRLQRRRRTRCRHKEKSRPAVIRLPQDSPPRR